MTKNISFDRILTSLRDNVQPLTPKMLAAFSDLTPAEATHLQQEWPRIPVQRKRDLLRQLADVLEDDFVASFETLAKTVIHDEDAQVRAGAIRLLWDSGDPRIATTLLDMLQNDPDPEPRAEAASVLGSYIYLGELEELDPALQTRIEDAVLAAAQSDADQSVQRKAIEALGYSSRKEVPALIESAYKHADPRWVASALFAMGRSSDPTWEELVIRAFTHEQPLVRLAAVEAAGELELSGARDILLNILEEEDEDEDLTRAVIWSLSQIGGEDVRTYFYNLLDATEDEDLMDFIEEALDNLTFSEGKLDLGFDLFNFDPDAPPEDDR